MKINFARLKNFRVSGARWQPATATARPEARSILTHEDKLFFLHIPRTAGGRVIELLENFFEQSTICPAYATPDLARLDPAILETYRFFRGQLLYDYDSGWWLTAQKPKILTFLREPVAQTFSIFANRQARNDQAYLENEIRLVRQLSLAEYIYNSASLLNLDYRNNQTSYLY